MSDESFITDWGLPCVFLFLLRERGDNCTVLKVKLDVVAADIRCHGDDGCPVELANQVTRRDTVEVGHDDIHENHVILGAILNFVDSLQAIKLSNVISLAAVPSEARGGTGDDEGGCAYCGVDNTLERV